LSRVVQRLGLAAGLALFALAGCTSGPGAEVAGGPATASAPAAVSIDGVVRKVDKGAGKLTIWHGDVPQLQMGPMTMAFRVKDAAWLDRFKVGDKVRFQYQRSSGGLTITAIEPAR